MKRQKVADSRSDARVECGHGDARLASPRACAWLDCVCASLLAHTAAFLAFGEHARLAATCRRWTRLARLPHASPRIVAVDSSHIDDGPASATAYHPEELWLRDRSDPPRSRDRWLSAQTRLVRFVWHHARAAKTQVRFGDMGAASIVRTLTYLAVPNRTLGLDCGVAQFRNLRTLSCLAIRGDAARLLPPTVREFGCLVIIDDAEFEHVSTWLRGRAFSKLDIRSAEGPTRLYPHRHGFERTEGQTWAALAGGASRSSLTQLSIQSVGGGSGDADPVDISAFPNLVTLVAVNMRRFLSKRHDGLRHLAIACYDHHGTEFLAHFSRLVALDVSTLSPNWEQLCAALAHASTLEEVCVDELYTPLRGPCSLPASVRRLYITRMRWLSHALAELPRAPGLEFLSIATHVDAVWPDDAEAKLRVVVGAPARLHVCRQHAHGRSTCACPDGEPRRRSWALFQAGQTPQTPVQG